MPAPTEAQVRGVVADVRRHAPQSRIVGIRADRWDGPSTIDVNGESFRIALCQSPLHVREELLGADPAHGLVVLTGVREEHLGGDVLARLAKRKLQDIEPWRLARDLFHATESDPRLARHGWLAEALVECAPPEGYPAAPAGVLDAERIWGELQKHLLDLQEPRPDVFGLLRWADRAGSAERYRALAQKVRNDFKLRIRETAGPAGAAMLDAIEMAPGTDLVSLGLTCQLIFGDATDQPIRDAAVRFERFHRQGALPRVAGLQWADAAERLMRDIAAEDGPAKARARADRADQLLIELGAQGFLHLSHTSPLGFEQRLAEFGGRLGRAAAGQTPLSEAESAGQRVLAHRLARTQEARSRRVDMALRLVRWLRHEPGQSLTSLVEAANQYAREEAFVDLARQALLGGEHPPELDRAYNALLAQCRERRELQNARFGELLAGAGAAPPPGQSAIVPVEQVLERVVAPVASHSPVLFLVMDGLSRSVYYELLEHLIEEGVRVWKPDALGPSASWIALAAVPSITEVSRTSLFSGTLASGDAGYEKRAFASHPSLLQISRTSRPPVLFHKGTLTSTAGRSLAEEVQRAIASNDQRVVGVVLNVVDDLLFKGDQAQPRWTLDAAPLLRALVDAARSAGRHVVITSDHGHLLDDDSAFQGREAGERWREDSGGPPSPEEVRMDSRRVQVGGRTSIIVPWSERTRYAGKRNGYHGGATPQEMLLPLAVLSWSDEPPVGFAEAGFTFPEWWHSGPVQSPAAAPDRVVAPAPRPAPTRPLLEVLEPLPLERTAAQETASADPAWLAALLNADRFAEQKGRASGRGIPSDDEVKRLLMALHERGGKMTRAALAHRLALRPDRLAGLIAASRRLLNVDGLGVLDVHTASDTVELNLTMLARQFELPLS